MLVRCCRAKQFPFILFWGKRFVGQAVALPFKLVFLFFFGFFGPKAFTGTPGTPGWCGVVWSGVAPPSQKLNQQISTYSFSCPMFFFSFFLSETLGFCFSFFFFLKATSGRFGSRFSHWRWAHYDCLANFNDAIGLNEIIVSSANKRPRPRPRLRLRPSFVRQVGASKDEVEG